MPNFPFWSLFFLPDTVHQQSLKDLAELQLSADKAESKLIGFITFITSSFNSSALTINLAGSYYIANPNDARLQWKSLKITILYLLIVWSPLITPASPEKIKISHASGWIFPTTFNVIPTSIHLLFEFWSYVWMFCPTSKVFTTKFRRRWQRCYPGATIHDLALGVRDQTKNVFL